MYILKSIYIKIYIVFKKRITDRKSSILNLTSNNEKLTIILIKEPSFDRFLQHVKNNNFPIIYINDDSVKNDNILDTSFLAKHYFKPSVSSTCPCSCRQ
jgi:hypothetical protein